MTRTSIGLAVAAGSLLSIGFSAEAGGRPTIYEGLLAGEDQCEVSTFAQLMNEVFREEDLQRIFDGEHRFTVFAPSNAAFAGLFDALSEDELASFQDLNTGRMERLLRYHVTQGEWRHPTGGLRMLDDSVAHTHAAGRTFRIDDATVQAFTRYRNGLVAKIDRVLSPADAPLPTGPVPTATVHTNILRFDAFASLSGTPSGHDATDSDSYEFRKFQDNELVIDATRRKSEGPALFFMTDIQWTNILSTGSSVQQPFHLNFAQSFSQIEATTDGVAFTCNDVRFGQGVRPEDKLNWWVGQPGASRDDKTLTLKCRSSTPDCFLVIDSKGGDDTFGASAVCVPPD